MPYLELGRKAKGERPEDLKEISIIDEEGSRRVVDLVEGIKVPKQE
jgi:hypothetical protein